MTLLIDDENRVRTLTLNRPEALNAFNEALYDATADALVDAADDPEVAVVVITGAGRAFSAGQDLAEMQARIADPRFTSGKHGFPGLIDALSSFPKPLICAVNGVGVGLGRPFSATPTWFSCPPRRGSSAVHQSRSRTRSRLLVSVAAIARTSERSLAADVLRMGGCHGGSPDGAGVAGLRTGRSDRGDP